MLADAGRAGRLIDHGRAYVKSNLDRHAVLRQAEQFVEDLLAGATYAPQRPM